jgi:hypothetical protein
MNTLLTVILFESAITRTTRHLDLPGTEKDYTTIQNPDPDTPCATDVEGCPASTMRGSFPQRLGFTTRNHIAYVNSDWMTDRGIVLVTYALRVGFGDTAE